jgi:GT2 family glycosyltransferase/glycosyltransferase involved in cell wall biosynthesis
MPPEIMPPSSAASPDDPRTAHLARLISSLFDAAWYQTRYPDIVAANLDPLLHFIRFGAAEKRDPNRFFDSSWYVEHYPDVASSGLSPLTHYLQAGARELRNPHPRFDAVYYVDQHPDAAANPLLYHLQVGLTRGYLTEKPIDIRDYLPSGMPPPAPPRGVFVDVIIPVYRDLEATRRCITSVLADRAFPLARIIVIDDASSEPGLAAWLRELAAQGHVHLIRNRRNAGFAASVNLGIAAAETHDVVVLHNDTEVFAGWLGRLTALAWSHPRIATVSPFSNAPVILGEAIRADGSPLPDPSLIGQAPAVLDEICRTVNTGRSIAIPAAMGFCMYVRRDALRQVGAFETAGSQDGYATAADFCRRASAAGWQHRLACDTFVFREGSAGFRGKAETPARAAKHPISQTHPGDARDDSWHAALAAADPFRFAVTAEMFRRSGQPVILMISHDLGGGVRRHIDSLVNRYRNTAHVFLLEGTDRGAALSVPSMLNHPVLKLPSDRIDDLVLALRSANLSRVHIHHLLHVDMDIRKLVHRLGVPFDVTVHDYYAICPQINLLSWPEGLYCGEPAPAICNACIADLSSHGARDILSWRREKAWQFIEADRVICPSGDVAARLVRYGVEEKAIVSPHEQDTPGDWPVNFPEWSGPALRIVLIGVLANHKGARTVAAVAEAATPGSIEIHLIGHLEPSFPKPAVRLISATGKYQEEDLAGLLDRAKPHVFWFPSSAPETYSYTLSSAIASGLPIVATKLGAFPERLAGRPNTWLVAHDAPTEAWLAAFEAVKNSLREPVARRPVPRPQTNSDFYGSRYLVPGGAPGAASGRSRKPGAKPRIVILPERLANGSLSPCAYIRLLLPLDHPSIGGGFEITLADLETVFDYDADIIATQRYAIPDVETADRLGAHAKRTGATLLFDLDDDLLNIPATHPDARQLRPRAKAVRRMLTLADTVWVSTQGLAERLSSIRPDAVVIENLLDERIWTPATASAPYWDDPVRILCMGTSTRDRDFAFIEPALTRLKAEYGHRIAIDVLGMTGPRELPPGLNRIGPSPHATRSYPGFVNWLKSVRPAWHIGLAPLLDTPFNRCKSGIKALDYAAIGLATLASDVPAYRGSFADQPNGQLVANDHQAWHAALDWLIRDQSLRRSLAAKAKEAFLARGTLLSHADQRRTAWTMLLPDRTRATATALQPGAVALTIPHGTIDPTTRTRRHSGRGR